MTTHGNNGVSLDHLPIFVLVGAGTTTIHFDIVGAAYSVGRSEAIIITNNKFINFRFILRNFPFFDVVYYDVVSELEGCMFRLKLVMAAFLSPEDDWP